MAEEEIEEETGKEETSGKKPRKTIVLTAAAIIKKRFGRDIKPAGDRYKELPKAISTGSILLNNAIGPYGGYPEGSVIEVFGWEGAGKTLLLYLAIAEAQKKWPNKPCVLIDAERQFQFQAKWAEKVGVDISKLIVLPVSTAEEGFDIAHALILGEHEIDAKTGQVVKVTEPGDYAIIGFDSVTQMVSMVDATKGMGETRQRGTQALAIGLGLKKVSSAMSRSDVNSQTILFFINQLRKNPNQMFGSPEYRTGGNALPFYDTIALKVAKVWKSEVRDELGNILSHDVKVTFEKNKAGSTPEEAICFTLMHDGSGVNNEQELFDVALMNGILKEYDLSKDDKPKIRYNFIDPETGEKMDDTIKDFSKRSFDSVLDERPELKAKIEELIKEGKFFTKKDTVEEEVPESAVSEPEVNEESEDDKETDEKKKKKLSKSLRI
jgi:recombination protein RecA